MVQLGPAGRLVTTTQVSVTTTGGAGVSAGNTNSGSLNGYLLGAYVNYHASAPATTDVTISYGTPAWGNILVLSNINTDTLKLVRMSCVDAAGAAISGMADLPPLDGTVNVAVAGCDDLTGAVVVTLIYLQTA